MPVAAAYKPPQLKKKIVIMSLDNEKKLSFKISLEFHIDAMDPFNFLKMFGKLRGSLSILLLLLLSLELMLCWLYFFRKCVD